LGPGVSVGRFLHRSAAVKHRRAAARVGRAAVSKYWEIDEIRPAFIHANMLAALPPDVPFGLPTFETDEKGRQKMPAYLLTAHKSG